MKLSGMAGTGSGKLGSQVYASVAGEQIVRNYQPKVANPNTSLQVNQRARLKLMSQLSAVMGPVLAFRKKGLVSARNQFVKANFDLSSGNDGQAMVTLENLQITSGTAGLPGIRVYREGGFLHVRLLNNASVFVDRVCYVFFKKTSALQLQLLDSVVVTDPVSGGDFHMFTAPYSGDILVLAYGMKDLNSNATAKYGNYTVETGEDIASLIMSRQLSYDDYRFTRTRGAQILADSSESQSAGPNQSRVFVTASGDGTVTGAGVYNNGTEVILTATPAAGNTFVGWKVNGTNEFVSYSATMRFPANGLVDLIAVFNNPESSTGGLDGGEVTNPLPVTAAVVTVDGTRIGIQSGQIDLQNEFDEIVVAGLGTNETLTFVPNGSYLGADDNIAFTDDGQPDGSYILSGTGIGSGAVYYAGNVFFYVVVSEVVFPQEYTMKADNVEVTLANDKLTLQTVPDYLEIEGLDAGKSIIFVPEGSYLGAADNDIFNMLDAPGGGHIYVNSSTGSIDNGAIYYEGAKWFDIIIGEDPLAPVANAIVKASVGSDEMVVDVTNGELNHEALQEILKISNVDSSVNLSIHSGTSQITPLQYNDGIFVTSPFVDYNGGDSVAVYCNDTLWFNWI